MAAAPQQVPSDAEVEQAVRNFRAAIDAAGPKPWAEKFIPFPRGACGHATELLGRYLIDHLSIRPDYVSQDANEDIGGWQASHAWLEWNGLTIDITGDQFGWAPVIVTRHPVNHGRGVQRARHPVCLRHQQDWWARECGPLWLAIAPHLTPILPARPRQHSR
ncbi:hypothetical protein GGQ61_002148 [Phenylobacterium haematophilum]|jgi:hypothetical protein|uniref:Uncharacterized protein n=1 Tax=Phenylobacterium haematophilum TaxID=98513 RepID=A0A840A1N4_9CAUL|nr:MULTISPECIES: hypothetical protein [Phenylobacterium]MBB3891431.1 hypothetical protein [Phenylobacterium haematophilum]MBP6878276.1 hypothetical protein [Phenylobacterium sp.]